MEYLLGFPPNRDPKANTLYVQRKGLSAGVKKDPPNKPIRNDTFTKKYLQKKVFPSPGRRISAKAVRPSDNMKTIDNEIN